MKFETAATETIRLGVNIRTVQKWAKIGKLAGAEKAAPANTLNANIPKT